MIGGAELEDAEKSSYTGIVKSLDSNRPITVGSIISRSTLASGLEFAGQCDWAELRLDHLHPERKAPTTLAVPSDIPLVLTARGPNEGGANSLTLEERSALLDCYLSLGIAIDLEAVDLPKWSDWLDKQRPNHDFELIASYHDFHQTPSIGTCEGIIEQAFAAGADLVKLAFHVDSLSDMQLGLDLLGISFPGPISVMGMGPLAPVSRLLYAQHGSCLNYGFLGDIEAAPGQWPAKLLKDAIAKMQLIDPAHR